MGIVIGISEILLGLYELMMPVFTYKVDKQQYRQTSQPYSMEKYRSQLRAGETYTIFVLEAT